MTSRGDQVTAVALGLLFSVSFVEIPLASLGALSFTSTELCIACWLVAAAWVTRARGWRPDQIGWGLLAVMASMLLTTAVVPADRGAALKFVIRFGVGVLVYLSLRAALHGPRLLTALRALTVAGLCFSALGAVQHYFPGVLDPVLSLIVPNKFAAYDPAAPLSFTTGVFFDGREFVVRASAVFG